MRRMASKQIKRNMGPTTTGVAGQKPSLELLLRALNIMNQSSNIKAFMETYKEGVTSVEIASESCPNEVDILIRKQVTRNEVYFKVTKHQCAKCVQTGGLPTGDKWFLQVFSQNSATNKVANQSMNKAASSVGIKKQQKKFLRKNIPDPQTSFGKMVGMQNQNMSKPSLITSHAQNLPDPQTSLGNMAPMQNQNMNKPIVIKNYNKKNPPVLQKLLVNTVAKKNTKKPCHVYKFIYCATPKLPVSQTPNVNTDEIGNKNKPTLIKKHGTKPILTSKEEVLLIELVKQHPLLYDLRHKQYRDAVVHEYIWRKISKKLGKPAEVCKEYWENTRDEYKRRPKETKMGSASVCQSSKRNHNGLLSFLDYKRRLVKYIPKFDTIQEIISDSDKIDPNNEKELSYHFKEHPLSKYYGTNGKGISNLC